MLRLFCIGYLLYIVLKIMEKYFVPFPLFLFPLSHLFFPLLFPRSFPSLLPPSFPPAIGMGLGCRLTLPYFLP